MTTALAPSSINLDHTIPHHARRGTTVDPTLVTAMLDAICTCYHVSLEDIRGGNRRENDTNARRVAAVCLRWLGCEHAQIGIQVGRSKTASQNLYSYAIVCESLLSTARVLVAQVSPETVIPTYSRGHAIPKPPSVASTIAPALAGISGEDARRVRAYIESVLEYRRAGVEAYWGASLLVNWPELRARVAKQLTADQVAMLTNTLRRDDAKLGLKVQARRAS